MERLAELGTVIASLSALAIAVVTISRTPEPMPPSVGRVPDRKVDDWKALRGSGHWVGANDPRTIIVEFADYECPGCRAWQPVTEAILAEYPDDVALIIRHWPLPYHSNAYSAARAVECAADQGRFWDYHRRLMRAETLDSAIYERIASSAEVPDTELFNACLHTEGPHDTVERDIAAAAAAGALGTPAVIVDGVLLGYIPTVEQLRDLIEG